MGLTDEEIEYFGWSYLFDVEEEASPDIEVTPSLYLDKGVPFVGVFLMILINFFSATLIPSKIAL